MGLLMNCFLNSSSHHGDEDRDQTSRASLSSTSPPPSGQSSSSTPLSFEASSSSILPLEQQYEVFLSFRGETRRGFTDHLYKRLDNAKVSVFRDKEGLPIGERSRPKIVKAIDASKISILIISPDYASSEWCLNELIQILKCKKMFGQLVIPIFYRVTPSDLQKKLYVESQLCKKRRHDLDGTHVQEWKDALIEVSYMVGLESEKIADGYEGELVEIVVTKVLKALRKLTLVVSDDLVGVDDHVEKIMKMVNVEGSNDVCVVLIYGMGGIGKTTLAKVIYNRLTHLFDCCSFLANIRETWSRPKGDVELQEQLILNVLGQKQSISSVDEGVKIARDGFKYKKVLILLDDVDHRDQLNALANQWFGRGSMLIVTSRMKDVLKDWEGSLSYELDGLTKDQSFQLFCKHAFKKGLIPNEFYTIAEEIVSTTGGLPLAIEVIGSLLYGKNRRIWEEKLKKLKNIPDGDVQDKLKISFDALEHEEKHIFLDIACLPIRRKREFALHMWDSCGFYPELGIENLISKSLIKIGEKEKLVIHDQLRDLGREIVRRESTSLGERSRLWKEEEAREVLESKQGTKNVKALCLGRHYYRSEQFEGMTKLRYLEMKHVRLTGDFENLFQNLRWLILYFIRWDFGESDFTPKKLVVLESSWSDIDWRVWSQMERLKVLKLRHWGYYLSPNATPDFSASKELEVLLLDQCDELIDIHPSVGSLVKLRRLVIRRCERLTEIPKLIGKLKLLIEIDLRWTGVTQLPDSIGDLCNLKSLLLVSTPIRYLPTSIRMLSKLQVLDLGSCSKLELLPSLPCSLTSLQFYGNLLGTLPNFSNLTNLEVLHIRDDFVRFSRALDFRNLNRMQSLRMDDHMVQFSSSDSIIKGHLIEKHLEAYEIVHAGEVSKNTSLLLELPSNLVELEFKCCSALRTLPNFSNLKKLKDLTIRYCHNLVEINGLENAESIRKVSICCCSSLERIGDLSQLKMLTTLQLLQCNKLSDIGGMGISVTNLLLESLVILGSLLDFSTAKGLKDLTINNCNNLVEINGLENAERIQKVSIYDCSSLERIGDLSQLKVLTTLQLLRCNKLSDIGGMGILVTNLLLESLVILGSLLDLSTAKGLKDLTISNCNNLVEINGLENAESIQKVSIYDCSSLERIGDLSHLKALTTLQLRHCDKLSDIGGIGISVTNLILESLIMVGSLLDLSTTKKLKDLTISDCNNLVEINGLENAESIQKVSICDCSSLKRIGDLSPLKMLTTLDLYFCEKLSEIQGLENLTSLEVLNIHRYTAIQDLSNLPKDVIKSYTPS